MQEVRHATLSVRSRETSKVDPNHKLSCKVCCKMKVPTLTCISASLCRNTSAVLTTLRMAFTSSKEYYERERRQRRVVSVYIPRTKVCSTQYTCNSKLHCVLLTVVPWSSAAGSSGVTSVRRSWMWREVFSMTATHHSQ